VNATTPAGGNCPSLFTNATPPSGSNIAAPVNVFQAALDIAQYPGDNVGALYGLISTSPAFPYTLPAAPNDWTIGVTYTGSLLVSGTGLGISSADQVYVTGTDYLLNFSPQGVGGGTNLLASYVGTTTSPTSTPPVLSSSDALREIAFDKTGNMFITDGSVTGVYEYSPATTNLTFRNFNVAPVSEANANTYAIAIDGDNDVWTSSYSKATCASVTCPLIEFPSTATASPSYPAYTPFSTFGGFGVAQPTGALGGARGIAFDVKTGNLWITSIDDNLAELFKVTPSTAGVASATAAPTQLTGFGAEAGSPGTNTAYGTFSVAVDSTGRAWFVVAGGPVSTKSGSTTSAISSAIYPVSTAGVVGTAVTGGGLSTTGIGANIVIDGNNNLFVGSQGSATTSAVIEYSPALSTMLSPNIGFSPGSTYAAGALSGGNLYEPDYLEVDKSGALWVLSSGSGASGKPANVIQILGLAAPTDPVLVDGNNGVKP